MKCYKSVLGSIVTGLCLWGLTGCGEVDRDLPFQYSYLSPTEVAVRYAGSVYHLRQDGNSDETPFDFQFESDGDVNIVLDGKRYEIDSPYDEGGKALKKSTKTPKKSTKKLSSGKRR